jgi:D-erythronate 2-dehydrogenase
LPATLPVPDTTRHWFASPRSATGFFLHAAHMATARVGPRRALNMPGLSATVAEEIEALRRVAGQKAVDLIRSAPDPMIASIVKNWAGNFAPDRATALGFVADASFDDIIRAYLQDDAPRT